MIIRRLLSTRPAGASASASLSASPVPWVCPSCTRSLSTTSLLQPTQWQQRQHSMRLSQPQQHQKRSYNMPKLNHERVFNQQGVPNLFSLQGYKLAWEEYQYGLIQKLTELTAGDPIEHQDAKSLILQFARDPMNASLFNHASAAHNNHHFFSTLAPEPVKLENYPQLRASLEVSFGSIETLKHTLIDTGAAMFGPGYVWLVWARDVGDGKAGREGGWRILTTYLAGTPYAEAGYRQQGLDMASNNAHSLQEYYAGQPANYVGSFGPHSASGREAAKLPPGGSSVMPVLCVSTWEHTWLFDFGMRGKRHFLSKWWDVIDWSVVNANAPQESMKSSASFLT